jgi:hypothetical protein
MDRTTVVEVIMMKSVKFFSKEMAIFPVIYPKELAKMKLVIVEAMKKNTQKKIPYALRTVL